MQNNLKFKLYIQFFAEGEPQGDQVPPETQQDVDLAEKFLELKKNTVPREEYLKLKHQMATLMDGLQTGDEPEEPEDPGSKPEYKTREPKVIAEEFLGKDRSLTNLSYVEHALELRKSVMERGGRDPFLPNDPNFAIQESDIEAAEFTATALQALVDKAAGDPNVFRGLLETTLKDGGVRMRNPIR